MPDKNVIYVSIVGNPYKGRCEKKHQLCCVDVLGWMDGWDGRDGRDGRDGWTLLQRFFLTKMKWNICPVHIYVRRIFLVSFFFYRSRSVWSKGKYWRWHILQNVIDLDQSMRINKSLDILCGGMPSGMHDFANCYWTIFRYLFIVIV